MHLFFSHLRPVASGLRLQHSMRAHNIGPWLVKHLCPAVAKPPVTENDNVIVGGSELTRDSLHPITTAPGHNNALGTVVSCGECRIQVNHHILEGWCHVVESTVRVDDAAFCVRRIGRLVRALPLRFQFNTKCLSSALTS